MKMIMNVCGLVVQGYQAGEVRKNEEKKMTAAAWSV